MNIADWLKSAVATLQSAEIPTARLDCLVLLEDVTKKDRAWLLAHPELALQIEQQQILHTYIAQRADHTPLSYIRGTTEFYGRDFIVTADVLEPRPESETIITMLKRLISSNVLSSDMTTTEHYHIVDVGTGSGSLAITAKLELPNCQTTAIDIDPACIAVARENAVFHGATIDFMIGNVLEPIIAHISTEESLILLCNLPYVPEDYSINTAATHEPRLALFSGKDGLDLYRVLFAQLTTLKRKPVYILAESLPTQHQALAAIAKVAGYSLQTTDDFIQLFRP